MEGGKGMRTPTHHTHTHAHTHTHTPYFISQFLTILALLGTNPQSTQQGPLEQVATSPDVLRSELLRGMAQRQTLPVSVCVCLSLSVCIYIYIYICMYVYIYMHAVELLSGPSLAFSRVIIWSKFAFF